MIIWVTKWVWWKMSFFTFSAHFWPFSGYLRDHMNHLWLGNNEAQFLRCNPMILDTFLTIFFIFIYHFTSSSILTFFSPYLKKDNRNFFKIFSTIYFLSKLVVFRGPSGIIKHSPNPWNIFSELTQLKGAVTYDYPWQLLTSDDSNFWTSKATRPWKLSDCSFFKGLFNRSTVLSFNRDKVVWY